MTKLRLSLVTLALALGLASSPALARKGQDFPGTTCTCKACGAKGADGKAQDVTGQCASVCKDKEVYDKGSEPHDYCKAKARTTTMRQDHIAKPDKLKAAHER